MCQCVCQRDPQRAECKHSSPVGEETCFSWQLMKCDRGWVCCSLVWWFSSQRMASHKPQKGRHLGEKRQRRKSGTVKGEGGYKYKIYKIDKREGGAGERRLFILQFQLLKNLVPSHHFYVLHLIIFSTWSRQNPFSFKIICSILEKMLWSHTLCIIRNMAASGFFLVQYNNELFAGCRMFYRFADQCVLFILEPH